MFLQFLKELVYIWGLRPKPGSFLYSESLEVEEKWRTGK